MKRINLHFIISLIILCSCQRILFNDTEGIRGINLEDFHAVSFSGIYDILLVQDSVNRLVIAGRNNINSIDAVVINDTLYIDDHKKMSFIPGKNKLTLHFSNIKYMITYDPVSVSNEDTIKTHQFLYDAIGEIAEVRLVVNCNYLVIVNSANTLGFFHIKGEAKGCSFYNRYGCTIFADSLLCENAEITNESVGDVRINASVYLKAFILGRGNICYHGNPLIEIAEKRGDGRLIKVY
jgi:hypothetical protein